MKMFLDPQKPIYTCSKNNCNDCDMHNKLYCHFTPKKLLVFLTLSVPLLILASIMTFRFSAWVFALWICFALSYFGFIEIRVMCSHCPHYAEPSLKTLKCWANYGSPKPWKYQPGPMTLIEKVVFFAGISVIILIPLVSAILYGSLLLLALFAVLLAVGVFIMSRYYCNQCMNFACPFNLVKPEVRNSFLKNNPVMDEAWRQDALKYCSRGKL